METAAALHNIFLTIVWRDLEVVAGWRGGGGHSPAYPARIILYSYRYE